MLKFLLTFGAGLYTGVYIAQTYQIDKVDDPQALFMKLKSFVNEKMAEISDDKKK